MGDWPCTGRGSRAGQPPTELQARAILFIWRMGTGPLGDCCTRKEIEERVPELTLDELNDILVAEWARLSWWGVIGGEPSGEPDCYSPTVAGTAFLRAEQAKGIPEHEHEWREMETKERFDPPWEICSACGAWRTGPDQPTRPPDL